jgi:isocitrate dehydrogenase (NAD+)
MAKAHAITLIPGDGIGPEVSAAVVRIVEAAGAATGAAFEWHRFAAGAEAFEKYKEYIPQALYRSIEENKVALKASRRSTSRCAKSSSCLQTSAQ